MSDWSNYPNFKESEFACKHTGRCNMHPEFMERLQKLRTLYDKPMRISSGYRDPTHPIEARKAQPGFHTTGRAADIAIRGADALKLLTIALQVGFTGVGVQQKGGSRFLHLDDIKSSLRPNIWSY